MAEINIDGTNCILGRLSSYVVKNALLGNKVNIFNCEKIIVSGEPKLIKEKYRHHNAEKGQPHKGPFIPRMPDRFVRRSLRGMLPYKKPRGAEAYKRIMCYIEIPEQFKDKKLEQIKSINAEKLPSLKKCTVKEICKYLGGKQ